MIRSPSDSSSLPSVSGTKGGISLYSSGNSVTFMKMASSSFVNLSNFGVASLLDISSIMTFLLIFRDVS